MLFVWYGSDRSNRAFVTAMKKITRPRVRTHVETVDPISGRIIKSRKVLSGSALVNVKVNSALESRKREEGAFAVRLAFKLKLTAVQQCLLEA
jgi:hypothetical protein